MILGEKKELLPGIVCKNTQEVIGIGDLAVMSVKVEIKKNNSFLKDYFFLQLIFNFKFPKTLVGFFR